jgi:hypothetical protein
MSNGYPTAAGVEEGHGAMVARCPSNDLTTTKIFNFPSLTQLFNFLFIRDTGYWESTTSYHSRRLMPAL